MEKGVDENLKAKEVYLIKRVVFLLCAMYVGMNNTNEDVIDT